LNDRERTPADAETVCDRFVGYICENMTEKRDIRRVLSWLLMLAMGIERIADDWGYWYSRQFWFKAGTQYYKVASATTSAAEAASRSSRQTACVTATW
jgi:hypothetical protein